jgi:murein DD-endopeptidase MepM/ murein hydrolase activator NlpD
LGLMYMQHVWTAYVNRATIDGGGCNQSLYDNNTYLNYVRITHSDGTYAYYLHLKYGGVYPNTNTFVERGQIIGLSGNSGYSCGAHLHFNVTTTSNNSTGGTTLPLWVAVTFFEGAIPTGGQTHHILKIQHRLHQLLLQTLTQFHPDFTITIL